MRNLQIQTSEDGDWADFRSGGFSLNLGVDALDKAAHSGEYGILFNDGSDEQGEWTSSDIRATATKVTLGP